VPLERRVHQRVDPAELARVRANQVLNGEVTVTLDETEVEAIGATASTVTTA
jgi:hypothetical protein